MPRFSRITPSLEQTIERMKVEILADIESGCVPASLTIFGDLHNHVDANTYGGLCEDPIFDTLQKALGDDGLSDYLNAAQDAVNVWMAVGRPATPADGPRYAATWGDGFAAQGTVHVGLSFFNEDAGYDGADRAAIAALATGLAWRSPIREIHSVTRVA